MSERELTDEQLKARFFLRHVMPIFGIILLMLGLAISAVLIPDVIETAAGPQVLTLSQAAAVANAQRTYARIEDGAWDCETLNVVRGISANALRYGYIREETRYSEVFFTDNLRAVVVFVTLSGGVTCDDLSRQWPAGYLYAMHDDTRQELTNEARLARYFTTDTFLELCGYCGQDNSSIGVVFGLIFIVWGLIMFVFGRRMGHSV